MLKQVFLLLALLLSFSLAQDEARLIVVKSIITDEPAASRDLIFNIQIFNVGKRFIFVENVEDYSIN